MRAWNLFALCLQVVNVKLNRFLDENCYFFATFTGRDTAWQVGNVSAETGWALLDDDEVFHL